jgi:hypothetical protein
LFFFLKKKPNKKTKKQKKNNKKNFFVQPAQQLIRLIAPSLRGLRKQNKNAKLSDITIV